MISLGVLVYIAFCALVGLYGSQRRLRFLGTLIVSFFITPVLMLLILVLTAPSPADEQAADASNT
jgi:hypothetical protein